MPQDEVTDWTSYEALLKEEHDILEKNVIPVYGIRIIAYIDEDGLNHVRWHIDGDSPDMASLIGNLDRVKFSLHMENLDFMAFTDEDGPVEEGEEIEE